MHCSRDGLVRYICPTQAPNELHMGNFKPKRTPNETCSYLTRILNPPCCVRALWVESCLVRLVREPKFLGLVPF